MERRLPRRIVAVAHLGLESVMLMGWPVGFGKWSVQKWQIQYKSDRAAKHGLF